MYASLMIFAGGFIINRLLKPVSSLLLDWERDIEGLLVEKRMRLFREWWNARTDEIEIAIENTPAGEGLGHYNSVTFQWTQIVFQEIEMWTRIGLKVDENELLLMAEGREFTIYQLNFVRRYLIDANLWNYGDEN